MLLKKSSDIQIIRPVTYYVFFTIRFLFSNSAENQTEDNCLKSGLVWIIKQSLYIVSQKCDPPTTPLVE